MKEFWKYEIYSMATNIIGDTHFDLKNAIIDATVVHSVSLVCRVFHLPLTLKRCSGDEIDN